MVAACEALKPADSQFREHNIYHVVEALLGQARVSASQATRKRVYGRVYPPANEYRATTGYQYL